MAIRLQQISIFTPLKYVSKAGVTACSAISAKICSVVVVFVLLLTVLHLRTSPAVTHLLKSLREYCCWFNLLLDCSQQHMLKYIISFFLESDLLKLGSSYMPGSPTCHQIWYLTQLITTYIYCTMVQSVSLQSLSDAFKSKHLK